MVEVVVCEPCTKGRHKECRNRERCVDGVCQPRHAPTVTRAQLDRLRADSLALEGLRLRVEDAARCLEMERSRLRDGERLPGQVHKACEVEAECLGRMIDLLDGILERR